MTKYALSAFFITPIALLFLLPTDANARLVKRDESATHCYHAHYDDHGVLQQRAWFSEQGAMAFYNCRQKFDLTFRTPHHSTGIVYDTNNDPGFYPQFLLHKVDDPHCVIESEYVTSTGHAGD